MFLGNLDHSVTEGVLESHFQDQDITPTRIMLRRGYALVDYPDQVTIDRAIDRLNGEIK